MDSKWSTADVRLFKDVGGQGNKVQGADKDTETKIWKKGHNSSVWKNKVRIPIFEKKSTIPVFGRNKVRIPMFGRIRSKPHKVRTPILIEKKSQF